MCVCGGGIRRGRGGLIEGKEKAEKCVGVGGGGGGGGRGIDDAESRVTR